MKRIKIAIAALAMGAAAALAGIEYSRATVDLGATTGTGAWTNGYGYSALKIVRLWDNSNLVAANTVTVKRVLTGTTITQTLGSVAFTSGNAGDSGTLTASYAKYQDELLFSSTAATGSTVTVDFEVQRH
jgi:hypothetical protein